MAARRLIFALLVLSLLCPCYAFAEEASYGGQDEQGAVQVSSPEGQGEEASSDEVASSGSVPSGSVSSSLQDEGSDSSLVELTSVEPRAAAGNESQLLTTLAYILGYNVNTNTGSFGSNIQVTYGVSATGSGILSYINTGNTRLSQISSTLSTIRSLLADVNSSASSMVSALRNSAGTAIGALQSISSRLATPDGTASVGSLTQSIRNLLQINVSNTGTIVSRLTTPDGTASVGSLAESIRNLVSSGNETIVQRLTTNDGSASVAALAESIRNLMLTNVSNTGTIVSRLTTPDGTASVGSLVESIRTLVSSGNDTIVQRLTTNDGSASVTALVDSIRNIVLSGNEAIAGDFAEILDALDSGFSSVVEAIESIEISVDVPSFDSSSIVDAIDSLTDVVEGLDLSTEVSPEVTVNVEDQTEQGLSLLDALLGVLDVAAIASSLSSLSSALESSFPFGALFMVASALGVLSSSPVAPSFSGSIVGVPIDIDLSVFDSIAALCRALLLVLYVIGLYHATRDWVFHSGGGDS